MESEEKVELIQLAIQKLMEEKRIKGTSSDDSNFVAVDDDDDQHLLLSRLLAQLETLKGESTHRQLEPSANANEVVSPAVGKVEPESETKNEADCPTTEAGRDEIVKELRKVRRQNLITHCLLSAMIVLTVTWQLSEVALIIKLKNGLSNPFKSFGSMLTGMLKGPRFNGQNGKPESSSTKQQQIESHSPLPLPIQIPEIAHVDLSGLGLNSDED
ncbi:hypothetical protein F0562_033553 [Nyssa sinensis]|uniref:Uncharacterized protein n=1 Tax=Nyssa sinensis TaxID=561372 RepID=A0A5J5AFK1_9ASTE|nr:hypothetical protein F0562_033553 [Nyssa sinensis]